MEVDSDKKLEVEESIRLILPEVRLAALNEDFEQLNLLWSSFGDNFEGLIEQALNSFHQTCSVHESSNEKLDAMKILAVCSLVESLIFTSHLVSKDVDNENIGKNT